MRCVFIRFIGVGAISAKVWPTCNGQSITDALIFITHNSCVGLIMHPKTCYLCFALLALSGCTISPSIRDVAPLDTAAVVRHIECETQIAVLTTIGRYLEENLKDPKAAALVRDALAEPDLHKRLARLSDIDLGKLYTLNDEQAARYVTAWEGVIIAFGYTFDITEDNDHSGGVNFLFPTGIGGLKVDMSSGLKRTRQNKQEFTVVTSVPLLMQSGACLSTDAIRHRQKMGPQFGPVVKGVPIDSETAANYKRAHMANPVYPITGSVGISDVLSTFGAIWRANARSTTLQPRTMKSPYGKLVGDLAFDKNNAATAYTQTLTFTTKVSGKLAPTIEISGSNLKKGTFADDSYRIDKHQLIIMISPPTIEEMEISFRRPRHKRERNAEEIRRSIYEEHRRVRTVTPILTDAIERQKHLLALERLDIRR